MSITAIVQNDTITLPPGVHVANGTEVEITLQEDKEAVTGQAEELTEALLAIGAEVKGLPSDLAAQHDHYLHGQPKR